MKKSVLFRILKGILFGLVISILLICGLALLLKSVELSENAISAICIAIKLVSVFFSCFLALKACKKKHGLLGGITASIYWGVCYALIGIFNGFNFDFALIIDFFATFLTGVICALIVRAVTK